MHCSRSEPLVLGRWGTWTAGACALPPAALLNETAAFAAPVYLSQKLVVVRFYVGATSRRMPPHGPWGEAQRFLMHHEAKFPVHHCTFPVLPCAPRASWKR